MKKIYFIIFSFLNLFKFHFIYRRLGNFLDKIRMSFLSLSGAIIGSQSVVREKCFILEPKNLEIGKNSSIGFYSEIYNSEKIIIGDNVDIGSQLYINTSNHKFDNPKLPISKQGTISKTINIGSNIWMGARVTILAGVKIEDKVIIGAGSLVNKDLESGYIYAGVPARKIKKVFE